MALKKPRTKSLKLFFWGEEVRRKFREISDINDFRHRILSCVTTIIYMFWPKCGKRSIRIWTYAVPQAEVHTFQPTKLWIKSWQYYLPLKPLSIIFDWIEIFNFKTPKLFCRHPGITVRTNFHCGFTRTCFEQYDGDFIVHSHFLLFLVTTETFRIIATNIGNHSLSFYCNCTSTNRHTCIFLIALIILNVSTLL